MNKFILLLFGIVLSLITAAPTRACDTEPNDQLTLSSVDEVHVAPNALKGLSWKPTSIEFESSEAYKPEMVDVFSHSYQYQSANPHEGGRGSPFTIVQSGVNITFSDLENGYHPKEEPT
ncbi:MAG: hypothetical protein ABJG41_01385 [Cyclobacteriaceae bacterium]